MFFMWKWCSFEIRTERIKTKSLTDAQSMNCMRCLKSWQKRSYIYVKVDLHKMEHQTLTGISSAKLHTLVLKDNSGTFQNILNLIAGAGGGGGVSLPQVQSEIAAALTSYSTTSNINTLLSNYALTSTLLASYRTETATNTYITTALGSYVTSSFMSTVLGSYVTNSSLATQLTAYSTNAALVELDADIQERPK